MSSSSGEPDSRVLVMMPVGLGHVFVIVESHEWHDIEMAFSDPHVVELDDPNGNVHEIDLYDCVSNAIVKSFDEVPEWSFFFDIESQGVQVFDTICWCQHLDKQITVEGPFYEKILALVKKFEGKLYDTRAVGLCKSRIQFDCKGRRYNAYLNASGSEPVVSFGYEGEEAKTMPSDYVTEMGNILTAAPDPAFVPDESLKKVDTTEVKVADLSAFDQAFCHDDADKVEGM
jgi:hypothetical protein